MWANENWTRRWDGADAEVLISQGYRAEDDGLLIDDFARHFRDKRYIRVDGRPLLMVYRPGIIPKTKQTVERWRAEFKKRHAEDPILVMAQAFGATDPREFGFDGAIEFPPHKHTQRMTTIQNELTWLDWDFSANVFRYEDVVSFSLDEPQPDFPIIKTIVPSWDNDARRQGKGVVIHDGTPAKYQAWLSELVKRANRNPFFGEPIVCVNAWNEWCEAAYLEPDQYFGSAFLNATGRAVTQTHREAPGQRILLVGHDAFPSGAQHLLLGIGRVLQRRFGVDVEFLLLRGGEFADAYRELAPTTVVTDDAELDGIIKAAAGRGIRNAILNTTASARAIGYLDANGIESVLLIHELPSILRAYDLLGWAKMGLQRARHAVFAARTVQNNVLAEVDLKPDARMHLLPQGCYKNISYSREAGEKIRKEFKIADREPVVVCVGYAELRKGFDHFLQLWRFCNQSKSKRVHFVWVGGIHLHFENWMSAEIEAAKASGTFHMPGHRSDVESFLSAGNVFVLTSREDPFPTVIHEALSVGLPCIAFDKAGGMSDFLRDTKMGTVVPYGDVVAMAHAVQAEIAKGISPADRAKRHEFVLTELNFEQYVGKLLQLVLPMVRPVSVAVPNYNYGRLMGDRLGSIFQQTYPVHEVIVLDDRSTDDSLEVIKATAAAWKRDIALVPNKVNSGSVFKQWRKAAETATGEFLWIAEADDLSEPNFLAEVMNVMQDDPNIGLAFSDSSALSQDGSLLWENYKGYYAQIAPDALTADEIFDGPDFVALFLSERNVILNVSAVVWRREVLLRVLAVCEKELSTFRMAGDWRLYLEALAVKGSKIAYVSTPLNKHRRHAESVTHTIDAGKHVAEIAQCHEFAAKAFKLPAAIRKLQQEYREKVTVQLSPKPVKREGVARKTGTSSRRRG